MKHILLLILTLSIPLSAGAFELSDSRLDMVAGKTQNFNIANPQDSSINIHIIIEPETYKPLPAGAEDCSSKLRAFPKTFKVDPKGTQTVKFISRQQGYCRVFFEVDKDIPDQIALNNTTNINTRYRIGIPVNVK